MRHSMARLFGILMSLGHAVLAQYGLLGAACWLDGCRVLGLRLSEIR